MLHRRRMQSLHDAFLTRHDQEPGAHYRRVTVTVNFGYAKLNVSLLAIRMRGPMTAIRPKFRVRETTPREFPRLTEFIVEKLDRGTWSLCIVGDNLVARTTREAAQALADRLERGEDISEDMKRVPVRWWDRPGFDPSRPVQARRVATRSRNDAR